MGSELLAIVVLAVVHVAGVGVMLVTLPGAAGLGGWWPRDGDDGDVPPADRPEGGPPLGDAEPSAVRLRERGRLADARRPRRVRAAEPERAKAPERGDDRPVPRATLS